MAIADLSNVLKIFGGGEPGAEQLKELYKEVALMTLARATSTDTNVQPVEVETVQNALTTLTGEQFSVADVRLAAHSGLFEKAPLEKYLSRAAKKLDAPQRRAIIGALAEVIQSDSRVSPKEVVYFNKITEALQVTPAELAGLKADHP